VPLNGGPAKALGYPASSTSYDTAGGASGGPYTQEITGYDTGYQPTGTSTTLPASDLVPGAAGTSSYTTTSSYTPLTGLLSSVEYSADNGLPAETVNYSYDLQGELIADGGATALLDQVIYDALGRIQRTTFGLYTRQLVQTYTRDPGTSRLTQVTTNLQTLPSAADTISYTYNPAGALTSATDAQNTGGTHAPCYSYDHLGELTAAWTDTQGTTTSPPPSVSGIGGCVTTTPSAATIGGPAPYWQSYDYNLLGDSTTAVYHDTAGTSGNDITQTSSYPGNGTTPATRPDAATSILTRRGAVGGPSTTLTPSYDPAGNTTSRAVTATTGTNPPPGPPAESNITYNPAGLTATITTSSGTSGYTYDAAGTLLRQASPAGTTLYLDGGAEQLTYNTATGTVTAQRFYPAPDGTIIVRSYDNNTQNTTITDQTTTPQGTSTEAVDATTQAITRRYYDPYGNPAGTVPAAWPDNHAYLGKPADPNTSLNLLGARTYDPATGRFLTLDPIYEAGNPLAMGGYAYASNNPATNSDPTGLFCQKDQNGNSVGNCYRDTGGGGTSTCTANPAICAPTDTTSTTTTGTTSDSGTTSTGTTSQVGCSSKVQERYSGCNSTLPPPVFTGGLKSFLAGGLGSLISIADIIRCAGSFLGCAQDIATGHTWSDDYIRSLHNRGIPTGPHSQYGAGYGSFTAITLFLGLIRTPAVAADEIPALFKPGPFARGSIPARGFGRDWTATERNAVNDLGNKFGCHSVSGLFICT
jgi:RHS repeat-associated protein